MEQKLLQELAWKNMQLNYVLWSDIWEEIKLLSMDNNGLWAMETPQLSVGYIHLSLAELDPNLPNQDLWAKNRVLRGIQFTCGPTYKNKQSKQVYFPFSCPLLSSTIEKSRCLMRWDTKMVNIILKCHYSQHYLIYSLKYNKMKQNLNLNKVSIV